MSLFPSNIRICVTFSCWIVKIKSVTFSVKTVGIVQIGKLYRLYLFTIVQIHILYINYIILQTTIYNLIHQYIYTSVSNTYPDVYILA
jgi:hypothetical protein